MNHKSDIEKILQNVNRAEELFKKAADPSGLDLLKKIIHRPGWTTPAEMRMTLALLETIQNQLNNVIALKGELVKAAELVGTEVHA